QVGAITTERDDLTRQPRTEIAPELPRRADDCVARPHRLVPRRRSCQLRQIAGEAGSFAYDMPGLTASPCLSETNDASPCPGGSFTCYRLAVSSSSCPWSSFWSRRPAPPTGTAFRRRRAARKPS